MELVLVDPAQTDQLAQAITKSLGSEAEVTPSAAEGEIRFSTDKDDEALSLLLAKITTAGIRITQFREVPMDLEDAFLSVTAKMKGGSGERVAEEDQTMKSESLVAGA